MSPTRRVPRPWLRRAAWLTGLALVTAGCTDATLREDSATGATTTTERPLAGEAVGTGPLDGMRGARPGAPIGDDFRQRVLAIDPTATDVEAAAQGYDATVVVALAAEATRNDAPGRLASMIVETTSAGRTCLTFRRCRGLALSGIDYDYDGVSGDIQMLADGDPGEGDFAVAEYRNGALTVVEHRTVQADPFSGQAVVADPTAGPAGDGTLTLGTLLPVTGPDGDAARGALAGIRVAVDEINAAQGVLGVPVQLLPDESGDGSREATDQAVSRLLSQKVDVVLGGTTSAVTAPALEPVTQAGVVLMSPTDSSRSLSIVPDGGLFFRIAPTTDLEGKVLGDLITEDGWTKVALVVGTGPDDRDLASDVTTELTAASATVSADIDTAAVTDPAAIAAQIVQSGAQAVLLDVGPDTTSAVLLALDAAGKRPSNFGVYGTSTNMVPGLATAMGVTPGA